MGKRSRASAAVPKSDEFVASDSDETVKKEDASGSESEDEKPQVKKAKKAKSEVNLLLFVIFRSQNYEQSTEAGASTSTSKGGSDWQKDGDGMFSLFLLFPPAAAHVLFCRAQADLSKKSASSLFPGICTRLED